MRQSVEPLGGRVRLMVMDEARIGQHATLTNVWAFKGSRPTVVEQTRYEWADLLAAVEPSTGFSSAPIAQSVNTVTLAALLSIFTCEVGRGELVVLIMDQAEWRTSAMLRVPDNIVILLLAPKSPGINPVKRLCHFMRSHYLSNRAYDNYDHIRNATGEAYRPLAAETLRSVCRCDYIELAL